MFEVKYARMPCTFLKPTAEYAENLISYLNHARSCSGASSSVQHIQPDSSSIDTDVSLSVGNHITAFWFDQTYAWHSGVIDQLLEYGDVSYIIKTKNSGKTWAYPEEADVHHESRTVVEYECESNICAL